MCDLSTVSTPIWSLLSPTCTTSSVCSPVSDLVLSQVCDLSSVSTPICVLAISSVSTPVGELILSQVCDVSPAPLSLHMSVALITISQMYNIFCLHTCQWPHPFQSVWRLSCSPVSTTVCGLNHYLPPDNLFCLHTCQWPHLLPNVWPPLSLHFSVALLSPTCATSSVSTPVGDLVLSQECDLFPVSTPICILAISSVSTHVGDLILSQMCDASPAPLSLHMSVALITLSHLNNFFCLNTRQWPHPHPSVWTLSCLPFPAASLSSTYEPFPPSPGP